MSVTFWKLNASIIALGTSLFSFHASAQTAPSPAYSSKDWKLENCVASTTAIYQNVTHHLEVSIDQTGLRPLEIRIRPEADLAPATLGIKAALDRKETQVYSFAPLASQEAGREIFWNIPRGTEALVSFLKREIKFETSIMNGQPVDPKAKVVKLAFSLKGSTNTINELQKRCNAGKALGSDGFERAFLPAVVATVDPTRLNAGATAQLRELASQALQAFKSSTATQTEINALTAKYLAQIKEYEQLNRNLDRLTHQEMVKLQTARTTSQAAIDKANQEIPQMRGQIGGYESMLVTANHDLEQANAVLEPLIPELRKLQSAVSNAEANLSSAQSALSTATNYESQTRSRLASIISSIGDAERKVQSLQNEANGMQSEVNRARSEVDSAKRDYDSSDRARRGFDRDSEIRNRIGRDSRHGSIDSDIRDRRGRRDQYEREQGSAEQEKTRASQAYRDCKADPARDCSAQRAEIDRAEERYRQAEDRKKQMDRDCDSFEREREEIRRRHERDVDSICNDMDRDRDQKAARLRDAEQRLASIERRQRDIVNVDIPQAQNEVSRLRSLRSEAESDVRTAESDVSRASSDVRTYESRLSSAQSKVSSYKKSVGYADKKAAVQKAEDRVDEIKKALSDLDKGIAKREKLIRDETANLASIEKQMQTVVATIQQKEARSAEVQKMLEPYNTEHASLAQKKAVSDQAFSKAQADFAAGLPQLAPVVAAQ